MTPLSPSPTTVTNRDILLRIEKKLDMLHHETVATKKRAAFAGGITGALTGCLAALACCRIILTTIMG